MKLKIIPTEPNITSTPYTTNKSNPSYILYILDYELV